MDAPRLEQTDRGATIYHDGRYLYSRRAPAARPERVAESIEVEERCLYVVPSPLLGYGLETLSARIPDNSHVLALEASQELMALCAPWISQTIQHHPKISWVRLSDRASLHAMMRSLGPWKFRRIKRVDLSGGCTVDARRYDELIAFIAADLATYWRNRHALGRLGRDWVRHAYANIAGIASGAISPPPPRPCRAAGVPVVVGAGPSLEAALPFLKRNRRNLWVLATDTAAMALLEYGITPDAIAVLETQAWNLLDFHGLSGTGIPLIADLTAYPLGMNATGGTCHVYSSSFADLEFLDRIDRAGLRGYRLPPLGSVGLASVELALSSTTGPVFLTGIDFCYTPGKSHSRGSSVHRWQLSNSTRTDPVPGWDATMRRPRRHGLRADGSRVATDGVLEGYAALFRDRYGGNERLMVLEPGGLEIGLPVVDFTTAAKLLRASNAEREPEYGFLGNGGGSEPAAPSAEDALEFLGSERDRLKRAIEIWDDYAEGRARADDVVGALDGMDQVYVDFPDEPPLPRRDDAFLVRAVMRCRKLYRYIERQMPAAAASDVGV